MDDGTSQFQFFESQSMLELQQMQEQFIEHQPAVITETLQVDNETQALKQEDELYDLHSSKLRELDAIHLNHLLRAKSELLAMAKAKEEVMVNVYQIQIQEEQESRRILDQNIAGLTTIKEELQQKVNFDLFKLDQIKKEMSTTGEIKNILKQHYDNAQVNYKSVLQNVHELEQKVEKNVENYEAKKQEICTAIESEHKNLEEKRLCFQNECVQYEYEMNEKRNLLQELNETFANSNEDIVRMTAKFEDLRIQSDKNGKALNEILCRNSDLRIVINNINLEELRAEKVKRVQGYTEKLNTLNNNLVGTTQRLSCAKEKEWDLQRALENVTIITNDLNAILLKREDEFEKLSTHCQFLEKNVDEINTQSTATYEELNCELQKINGNLNEFKEKLLVTINQKDGKTQELRIIQQNNERAQARLKELQSLEETLKKEIDVNNTKAEQFKGQKTDIENNIKNIIASLMSVKDNYFHRKETSGTQLIELKKKLYNAQTELQSLKYQGEMNLGKLRDQLHDYKIQTEKATQENRQTYKQNLEKLEAKLAEAKGSLEQLKEDHNQTVVLIDKKNTIRNNLEKDVERLRSSSNPLAGGNNSSQRITNELANPSKPIGILKSPGKSSSPGKKVSFSKDPNVWCISSESSIDTNVEAGNIVQWAFDEDEFDALLRTSPPQRLEKNPPRKRSRLYSP